MTTFLSGFKVQPNFPREDVTEGNAAIIEMMLSNRTLLELGHDRSEVFVPAFQQFHPAVVKGASRMYDEGSRIEAVNHGVLSFEMIAMILSSRLAPGIGVPVLVNSAALVYRATDRSVADYAHSAHEAFCSSMPRTSEVISGSSERFFGALAQYAQLGAAMMWQLELDSID